MLMRLLTPAPKGRNWSEGFAKDGFDDYVPVSGPHIDLRGILVGMVLQINGSLNRRV